MKEFLFSLFLVAMLGTSLSASSQIIEIIREASRKVIRAVDLGIQRQQKKIIWLQNAQKELENKISKLKLGEIAQWVERNRKLYDDYFKELWKVKTSINTYWRVKEIIGRQLQVINEFKTAWELLRSDKHFSIAELDRMYQSYACVLDESILNLDQLLLVISSFSTQMSDGARLEFISKAKKGVDKNLFDLRLINNRNYMISISRSSNDHEAQILKKFYGM